MIFMKKFIFLVLIFFSPLAKSADWVLLSNDELSSTFLDVHSVKRTSSKQVQFQIKLIFRSQRDMMGLLHNAASTNYKISCKSGLILFRQKFLLNDDEIVWTHPASDKKQKVELELSDEVLKKVCRLDDLS
jgi:hypothetical protein